MKVFTIEFQQPQVAV